MMVSEDEDLEFLRLAALKSRKRKLEDQKINAAGSVKNVSKSGFNNYENKNFIKKNKINKGHRSVRGNNRNNVSSSRVNTNLIAIPIAADSTSNLVSNENSIKDTNPPDSKEENTSKFNRYDHSDQSDSESDTNVKSNSSDNETPKRSERGDSLDRLMDELENEIAGNEKISDSDQLDSKIEQPKSDSEKKVTKPTEEKSEKQNTENIEKIPSKDVKSDTNSTVKPNTVGKKIVVDKSENHAIDSSNSKADVKVSSPPEAKKMKNDLPPLNNDFKELSKKRSPPRNVYRSNSPSLYRPSSQKRPLSPLRINTEVLNTITMAPLSPRSAAFVLQNREILAKRKLSPCRRSISSRSSSSSSPYRSPSRKRSISPYSRSRFAYSPMRRYSPPPRRRSISPQRNELFPRRRSPRSPPNGDRNYKRRSFSPRPLGRSPSPSRRIVKKRSNSPKAGRISPLPQSHKSNVYDRLGYKANLQKKSTTKYSNDNVNSKKSSHRSELSPSPRNNPVSDHDRDVPVSVDPKENSPKSYIDPILEARKRKFESNKPIEVPGGVVKIKLNKEVIEKENELSEGEDICDTNTAIADLWSSDESDNENEGRFKNSTTTNVNSVKRDKTVHRTVSLEKSDSLKNRKPELLRDTRRHRECKLESRKRKSQKLLADEITSKKMSVKKDDTKKNEKLIKRHVDVNEKVSSAAIDTVELKSTNNMRIVISDKPILNIKENRKVTEVPAIIKNERDDASNDSFEPEIVYEENETLPTESTQNVSDDLRTELSRRRAERKTLSSQSHASLKSGPPTRLLRTAFQEMSKKSLTSLSAFQKPSKGLKKERIGKLPIHMRLGKTCKTEDESRVRHKSDDEEVDDESTSDYNQSTDANSIMKKSKSSSKLQNYKGRKKRIFGLQV